MTKRGLKVDTDGVVSEFEITGLRSIQDAVGGCIEGVPWTYNPYCKEGLIMYCDEDGFGKPNVINCMFPPLMGNVVITKIDKNGADIGLTNADIQLVRDDISGRWASGVER